MAIKKYLLLGILQETPPLSRDSQFTYSKTLKGLLIGGGGIQWKIPKGKSSE